jgi:translation initiation factor 2 gamma subunit (eIF-2gamma)
MKSVIVGTAGHIDHGKTSLVKALTGIDADRLEEEKRRGITIDIGFAHLELPAPDGSSFAWASSMSPATNALCATCWRASAASTWCCS